MSNNLGKQMVTLTGPVAFFVPFDAASLSRADDEKRIVRGVCYGKAKVNSDKWDLPLDTLQRSAPAYMEFPAIREMHQPLAAGSALGVVFEDGVCRIEAYISDDVAWKKVKDGTYKGFSVNGQPKLVRGARIESFDWWETSLVDRPADPTAKIELWRAEGLPQQNTPIEVEVEEASEEGTGESLESAEGAVDGEVAEQPAATDAVPDAAGAADSSTPTEAAASEGVTEKAAQAEEAADAEGVQRVQTSATVPVRENLEGDRKDENAILARIEEMRQKADDPATPEEEVKRLRKAIASAEKGLGRLAGLLARSSVVVEVFAADTFADRAEDLSIDAGDELLKRALRALFYCLTANRNADVWHQNVDEFTAFLHSFIDLNAEAINAANNGGIAPGDPLDMDLDECCVRVQMVATGQPAAAETPASGDTQAPAPDEQTNLILQRLNSLESGYRQLTEVNGELLSRVQAAEGARDAAVEEQTRLNGELAIVREDQEAAQRDLGVARSSLSTAEESVSRLEGDVQRLTDENTQLRDMPVGDRPVLMPAMVPGTVARKFAANEMLEEEEEPVVSRVARLLTEKQQLATKAAAEHTEQARQPMRIRMFEIDQELTGLNRLAALQS